MSDQNEGLGALKGLAKRWLKNQLSIKGDPIQSNRANQDSRDAEEDAKLVVHDELSRAAVSALLPQGLKRKLGEMEAYQQQREIEREAKQRAELEARPRAQVRLSLSGDVNGAFEGELPIQLTRPETAGEALVINLEPLSPIAIGSQVFNGFGFAVPNYRGAGQYDLAQLAERGGSDDWDPFWFYLWLDSVDEQFYWSAPATGTVEVSADERNLSAEFHMEDAGSHRVAVRAEIALP